MDGGSKFLLIWVIISIVALVLCGALYMVTRQYTQASKAMPPTITPVRTRAPVATLAPRSTEIVIEPTPRPQWTAVPGSDEIILYRLEPLKKP